MGLNPAGKPVIQIYKEKTPTSPISPTSSKASPVESVTTGVHRARATLPTDRFPRPVPIGVSAGLAGVATGTLGARVTDGTNVYALSNNHVFAGVNTASVGDRSSSRATTTAAAIPADRIGTLAAYQTIDFNGGTNTMDAAIALTSTANVGTGNARRRLRTLRARTRAQAFDRAGACRSTAARPGFSRAACRDATSSVDVCYIALGEFCLQEARFAGQISISPGPFSAPGDSGSLDRHARRESARRASLRRR